MFKLKRRFFYKKKNEKIIQKFLFIFNNNLKKYEIFYNSNPFCKPLGQIMFDSRKSIKQKKLLKKIKF